MNSYVGDTFRHGDVDIPAVLAKLRARVWWIIGSIVIFTIAFGVAALIMTPVYRASTVVVQATSDSGAMGGLGGSLGQLGGLASLAGIALGSAGSQVEETLAVLRSRGFTEGFIRDNELLPELFHDRWDKAANQWRGNEGDWPTLAEAYEYFDQSVRGVTHNAKTGLITLRIDWRDPQLAAMWANQLVARLNAEMRARAIASTNASVGYLQKELDATLAVDTRAAISRLMEAQINQRMYANVTEEYSLRVVDRAMAPDPKDVVRPKKLLLIVLGLGLGFVFGVFAALAFDALSIGRREAS